MTVGESDFSRLFRLFSSGWGNLCSLDMRVLPCLTVSCFWLFGYFLGYLLFSEEETNRGE